MRPGGVRGAAVPVGMPRRERLARSGATPSEVVGLPFPVRGRGHPIRGEVAGLRAAAAPATGSCRPMPASQDIGTFVGLPFRNYRLFFRHLGEVPERRSFWCRFRLPCIRTTFVGLSFPTNRLILGHYFLSLSASPLRSGILYAAGAARLLGLLFRCESSNINGLRRGIPNGDRPVRHVSPDEPFPRKPWEAPARRKRNLMPEFGKRHGAGSTPCSWGSHSRPAFVDRQPARRLRLPGSWIPDSLRRVQQQVETAPVPRRPNLSTAAIHP